MPNDLFLTLIIFFNWVIFINEFLWFSNRSNSWVSTASNLFCTITNFSLASILFFCISSNAISHFLSTSSMIEIFSSATKIFDLWMRETLARTDSINPCQTQKKLQRLNSPLEWYIWFVNAKTFNIFNFINVHR